MKAIRQRSAHGNVVQSGDGNINLQVNPAPHPPPAEKSSVTIAHGFIIGLATIAAASLAYINREPGEPGKLVTLVERHDDVAASAPRSAPNVTPAVPPTTVVLASGEPRELVIKLVHESITSSPVPSHAVANEVDDTCSRSGKAEDDHFGDRRDGTRSFDRHRYGDSIDDARRDRQYDRDFDDDGGRGWNGEDDDTTSWTRERTPDAA